MEVNSTSVQSGIGFGQTQGGQDMGKDEFLKLLVAQLQNQDPLEPMSNSEFVAQLAQFSSVEQLVAVNEGINIIGVQQMGLANAQASDFIGKEVEVRSNKLEVEDSDLEVSGGFSLGADAASVEVQIRDSSGKLVRTIDKNAQSKGDVGFTWDLRDDNGLLMPPGTYTINVLAEDDLGNPVPSETTIRGLVDGVDYEAGYAQLIIGSIKANVSDVVGVYPETETTP